MGTPVDAKELVRFEILVGGDSVAANAIKSISGATLQTFDATKAASFGLNSSEVGNWKLFSVLGTKDGATYKVNNASIDLDQYFDGTISYKTRAVAIEPTTGQEGSASAVVDGTSAGSFTITPTVADNTYSVQLRDLDGNAIRSISLDEGGRSDYFTVAGTTFDPDESISVAFADTDYFTIEQNQNDAAQFRLFHKVSGVPTAVSDLTLTPSVTLNDSGTSATYAASASSLAVVVNEIASTPILSSTAALATVINDGQAGLNIALPTRTNAGDDALLYRLEGVPVWLTPSAGTLISTTGSGATALSVYQFDSSIDLNSLSWSATRSYVASDTAVNLSWKAIHVETSNMRTAESTAVPITLTLKPVAAPPEIIGPSSFAIDEGGFVALNQYSIRVPGFETSVINSSVSATVTLGAGATLEFSRAGSPVSAIGTVIGLTTTELASAKVLAFDENYYSDTFDPEKPPLSFTISATQTLGNSSATVITPRQASIALENVPENVEVVLSSTLTSASIAEGASFTIPAGGQVLGQVTGEAVSLSLKVNKAISLNELSGGTVTKLTALSIDGNFATYRIDETKFEGGDYQLVAPSGTLPGNYLVEINAQSVVSATGKAGVIDSASFTLAVTPVADIPIISVSRTALNLLEDTSASFDVMAYSPDATEQVRVYLQLVDASGAAVTGDVAQNVALALASTTGATLTPSAPGQWELLTPVGSKASIPITLTPPDNFANLIGTTGSNAVFDGLALKVSGRSELTFNSSTVSSDTIFASNIALNVTPIADGYTLSQGTFDALIAQLVPGSLSNTDPFALNKSAVTNLVNGLQSTQIDSDGSEFPGLSIKVPTAWNLTYSATTGIDVSFVQSTGTYTFKAATDLTPEAAYSALDSLLNSISLTPPGGVGSLTGTNAPSFSVFTYEKLTPTITKVSATSGVTIARVEQVLTETDTAISATGSLIIVDSAGVLLTTGIASLEVSAVSKSGASSGLTLTDGQLIGLLSTNLNSGATYNFTSGNTTFDYLANGQSINLTYTVLAKDANGALLGTRKLILSVAGTNDVPVLTATDVAGAITEGSGVLSDTGSIAFADLDLTDRPTATVMATKSVAAVRADGSTTLTLTADQQAAIEAAFSITPATGNTNNGTIAWTYSIAEGALNFLAKDEQVTAVFTVTLTDSNGGTVTQPVTVTITGTNDAPTLTATDVAGAITEGSVLSDTGSIAFADLDLTDRPTATEATKSVVAVRADKSTALTLTNDQQAAIEAAFSIAPATGNTNNGTINWTYSIAEGALDFLAKDEQVTAVFTVTLIDSNGGTVTQDVTVTITGSNDAPTLTATDVAGAITEGSVLSDTGSIAFADLDLTDRPTATEATKSVVAVRADKSTALTLTNDQQAAIEAAFSIAPATGNTNNGTINWTYSIAEGALDFLAKDEQVTAVFTVTLTDSNGGTVTQDVTVTITGTNDAPTLTATDVAGAITEGSGVLSDTGSIAFADLDLTDRPTAT